MSLAASRLAAIVLAAFIGGSAALAAVPVPVRAPPSRPAVALNGPATDTNSPAKAKASPAASAPRPKRPEIKWVSLRDLAARLGGKYSWDSGALRATLTGPAGERAELGIDSRETKINGLRVLMGDPTKLKDGQLSVSSVDAEHLLTPLLRPGYGIALPAAPKIIALDPGHGGQFDGTENKKMGLREKDLALDVALRLQKLLEARGYKVVMTRTKDVALAGELPMDWAMRSEIANRASADLFVSIHFNSLFPDTKTSGTEVYTFTPQYQQSDQSWGSGVDDAEMEASPVNRFDHWSAVLAQATHLDVLHTLKTFDRGKKTKHAAVLRSLNCPGVLVESAFLSSDAEAKRVATAEFRQQIAEALADGVRDYATTLDALRPKPKPVAGTAPSTSASNSP